MNKIDKTNSAFDANAHAISDDELDAVSGGLYEDYDKKKYFRCPACFKLILKTPAAFDDHNRNSGCRYKL